MQPQNTRGILQEGYFTPPELASELGRSIRTLGRWALTGYGPPRTRIVRRSLYRRDAVMAWLRGLESVPHLHRSKIYLNGDSRTHELGSCPVIDRHAGATRASQ